MTSPSLGAIGSRAYEAYLNRIPQPGTLFRLMSPAQKRAPFENTARSIGGAPREIQLRHFRNCLKADQAYGEGVAAALGIKRSEVPGEKTGKVA